MIEKSAEHLINDNMMSFSAYVLTQRALPDIRDGLKPVQRRILYSMKLSNTTNFTKSATVTGRVFALHPHGDTYSSIVNLVQKDRQNVPFLVGKGSWGQFTSKTHVPAASRYTEVKLGQPSLEAMKELKHNAIDMIPNHDGTIMVPEALPVTYPTILTNALSGIGVGYSSDTISYNLNDLRSSIEKILNNEEVSYKDMLPDFPTGGMIINDDKNNKEIENVFNHGKGSFVVRAKAKIEGNKIIVYELPYGVKREQIIQKIESFAKQKKLDEVKDVRDGTSYTGMKIIITVKNNFNVEEVLEKLYILTPMESKINANMNILVEGYPKVLGTKDILDYWIKWRKDIIKKTLINKYNNLKSELHLLHALKKILINIDEVIKIIRFSEDALIIDNLKKEFNLDDKQAEYISVIKLRDINKEKIEQKIKNIEDMEQEVEALGKNIKNNDFINKELLDRMDDSINKIDVNNRRTDYKKISSKKIDLIENIQEDKNKKENYDVFVLVTKNGFVFKDKLQNKDKNIREKMLSNDQTESIYGLKNKDSVYCFAEDSKVIRVKLDDIKDGSAAYVDNFIASFVDEDNEQLLIFDDGQAVAIPNRSFITNKYELENAYYNEQIIFVDTIKENENKEITLTDGEKEIKVGYNDVSKKQSRISKGSNKLRSNNKITIK